MSTPINTILTELKTILDTACSPLSTYKFQSNMGISNSCIVMQLISAVTRKPGLGRRASDQRFTNTRLLIQFDVYHDTGDAAIEYADKAIHAIFAAEDTLKGKGITLKEMTGGRDVAEQVGARLYRKSFDYAFEIYMTAEL